VILRGTDAAGRVGQGVASRADVNGDGTDDLLIGAPYFNGAGYAFLLLGGAK